MLHHLCSLQFYFPAPVKSKAYHWYLKLWVCNVYTYLIQNGVDSSPNHMHVLVYIIWLARVHPHHQFIVASCWVYSASISHQFWPHKASGLLLGLPALRIFIHLIAAYRYVILDPFTAKTYLNLFTNWTGWFLCNCMASRGFSLSLSLSLSLFLWTMLVQRLFSFCNFLPKIAQNLAKKNRTHLRG